VAQELLYQRWERVHSQLGSGCEDGGDDGDDDVEDDGGGTQQLEASWGIPQWPKGAAKGALLPAIFPTHTTDRFSSGFPTLFREYCARHV